jgi:hypothetical protein
MIGGSVEAVKHKASAGERPQSLVLVMPLFSLSLLCGMGEGRVRVLLIALVFVAVTP